MTLFEHLSELRRRLLITIGAVAAGGIVVWFLYGPTFHFLLEPYQNFLVHHQSKDISKGKLVVTGPLEGFTTRLKISVYGGVIVSSPVALWELWRFITPGLHRNEKKYALPFITSAVFLFAAGVSTAVLVFPKALNWLMNVSGPGVVPLFSPWGYVGLYMAMCLVFGVVFMYPIVLVFLEITGVVPSKTWRRWRRPAIVVIAAVSAVITPSSDPFTFLGLAVPMMVLYEVSIIVGRILKK